MVSQAAIIPIVATINIRDVPDEIASAIETAAGAANARSREAYLREFLGRRFGPDDSVVAAIAARARKAVELFTMLGHLSILTPAVTVPQMARVLGHPDASILEAELQGDRPFSFSDGDRLCDLFGLRREWLESGGNDAPRFGTRARHHDCRRLLHDLLEKGVPYEELYFVLSDDAAGDAAIIGHTESEDPTVGWRYDLLVDDIPIHDEVGGTGSAQRRDFADLMVALYDDSLFSEVHCIGRIVPHLSYDAMISGYVHPASVTSTYTQQPAQRVAVRSHWHEDFWDFEDNDGYSRGYTEGRTALLKELRADGIATRDQYHAHVRKWIRSRRQRRGST